MSVLNLSDLIPTYQTYIDAIIDEMGKPVTIFFEETVTNVAGEFTDGIRDDVSRMPQYKGTNIQAAPIIADNTETIIALLKFSPEDYNRYGVYVNQPRTILKLKTYLTHAPSLLRAKYIIPNMGDNMELAQQQKFKIVKTPIPVGLQINRYCISYWEQI